MNYELPVLIRTGWVFGVFAVALIGFHLVLVFWLKLGRTAWKRVDYIWLIIGALGILSALERPREVVSKNLERTAQERLASECSEVRSALILALAMPSVSPAIHRS